ncbi:sensor histidine kinase [Halalkalibacter wakoensis]|uniref:sensor histidine kinase n=1 Tax=Halalkalibacter wakoensis TaxID=127891 RepID=UPI001F3C1D8D|nr:HAMP domain-containing sensor histidine kinase [Halalkalibacter wakoensis]
MYLVFFEGRKQVHNQTFFVFLFSVCSMILCMTYPIKLDLGFIFDLRYIPFIVASLYGGFKIALPLYAVLNVYRFFIGTEGFIVSLEFSTIILMLIPFWSKTFLRQPVKRRILIAVGMSFFTMTFFLFTLTTFYSRLTQEFWEIVSNVILIHVIGTFIIIVLLEKILANIRRREHYLNSERSMVISELAASVSHEIRNPLTVTNGFLQLLDQSKGLNDEQKRYIHLSLKELNRAERIVSDFLSLAKPQAENMVYSNLKEESEYVNSVMEPFASLHQVTLHYRFENTLYNHYDKNQIQQCLINLYKNGIESMKGMGGTLFIEVFEKGKEIVIQIKDNGIGMSREQVLQMGKPYYSTKKEGTGLGMVMVYNTINKIGGKIEVDSALGKGTTFHITIPTQNKNKKA